MPDFYYALYCIPKYNRGFFIITQIYMKDKMAAMKSDFSGIGADETFAQSQPEIMENFLDWIDNT